MTKPGTTAIMHVLRDEFDRIPRRFQWLDEHPRDYWLYGSAGDLDDWDRMWDRGVQPKLEDVPDSVKRIAYDAEWVRTYNSAEQRVRNIIRTISGIEPGVEEIHDIIIDFRNMYKEQLEELAKEQAETDVMHRTAESMEKDMER